MKKRKKIILISVAAIVVLAVGLYFFLNYGSKSVVFKTTTIQNKTVEVTVTATGYVQPVDKLEVGTQVSGVIQKIYVNYNSHVKKGQLIAELDKSTLNERLSQAQASLKSSESALTYAQKNYDRVKQLYEAKAATEVSYEETLNALIQAQTSLTNAKANLHEAKVNLSYAEIYSPIDGVVLDCSVKEGQTVAASFSTPTLFTIAKDLKKMQVEANIDEADIGQVKVGQKVKFTVDAYADNLFEGTVNEIRLQPTVTSNVVTYTVIISAPNLEEKLFPGMTASITIVTNSETGPVVTLEALNFDPSQEVMNRLNKPEKIGTGRAIAPQKNGSIKTAKKVWIKKGNSLRPLHVETSLSDGIYTIVTSDVQLGDTIVLSASLEKKQTVKSGASSNPFMPTPPKH